MDKALLTRMRQEEAENLIALSTKKLLEIYGFDSEYLTSKIFSRNSAQSSNVLTYLSEYSSTSAFIAKQCDYEEIRPKDTWHWKYVDTTSQYIPSFYRNKIHHSNRHISIIQIEKIDRLKTPHKRIKYVQPGHSITDGNLSLQFELKNNKIEKKSVLNPINSWNIPVRKWFYILDVRHIKNASSTNPPPKHNLLMQINEIALTESTLLNQIPLNRTRNLLNNSVSKCGKTKSYLTPEICRKEFIKLSKSSSLSRKYR
ncbi:unnamed protein product [Schistosoma margrebowiei]|uniref:Uncharacterized protein n=1 Tax=Schistosoma margrebowiei TaxID=48269 RepID=A0A183MF35_9TREM|nr:unnamed protein product [Schistosoma margrebowiei]